MSPCLPPPPSFSGKTVYVRNFVICIWERECRRRIFCPYSWLLRLSATAHFGVALGTSPPCLCDMLGREGDGKRTNNENGKTNLRPPFLSFVFFFIYFGLRRVILRFVLDLMHVQSVRVAS